MTDQPEPRAIDEYSYPWAQTIDSADGGRTIRIPWLDVDGIETGSVWVFREDAPVLAAMLTGAARTTPDNPAASNKEPDSGLRDQYAAAIAADDGHPWNTLCTETQGSYLDNADAVMAVRDRRMQQLAAEVERLGDWCRTVTARALDAEADRDRWHDELADNETDRVAAIRRAETAEAKLTAVRALHQPTTHNGLVICRTCSGWNGHHYLGLLTAHPCATVRALDGPADTTPPAEAPSACPATHHLADTLIRCTQHRPNGAHRGRIPGTDVWHTWTDQPEEAGR